MWHETRVWTGRPRRKTANARGTESTRAGARASWSRAGSTADPRPWQPPGDGAATRPGRPDPQEVLALAKARLRTLESRAAKIQALQAGATTPGEKSAATAALRRLERPLKAARTQVAAATLAARAPDPDHPHVAALMRIAGRTIPSKRLSGSELIRKFGATRIISGLGKSFRR